MESSYFVFWASASFLAKSGQQHWENQMNMWGAWRVLGAHFLIFLLLSFWNYFPLSLILTCHHMGKHSHFLKWKYPRMGLGLLVISVSGGLFKMMPLQNHLKWGKLGRWGFQLQELDGPEKSWWVSCVYDVTVEWQLLQPLVENMTLNSWLPHFSLDPSCKNGYKGYPEECAVHPFLQVGHAQFRSHGS